MRLTIGRRIALGYGIAMALLMMVAGMALRSTRTLEAAAALRAHTFQVMAKLESMTAALTEAETNQRGYVITSDESYLGPYEAALRAADTRRVEIAELVQDNPVQQARLNSLAALVETKKNQLDDTVRAQRLHGFEDARQSVLRHGERRTMEEIRRFLTEMTTEEQRLLDMRNLDVVQSLRDAYITLVAGGLLAVLFACVSGWMLVRGLRTSLDRLMAGADRIGNGDFSHRITLDGDDEVTELAHAFNRMAERRAEAEQQIAAQGAAREHVLGTVSETVQKLTTAAQELLAGATQQASGMQEQTAAVTETVTVVDEVAHTSNQSAERARDAASIASRSEEAGRNGKRAVDRVIEVVNAAKTQSDAVAQRITALAGQTQAVGEIVTLINDMADQTNMLALNAAIEASRAGEHGRGFAIVAAEIKSLADESKRATQRVRQILGDIQKTANHAVLSTEESTRSMTGATRSAEDAGETIRTLENVISDVAEAAHQIAASAGQQATGLNQIHQAMRDINEVCTQNLAATHQAQRAAADLNTLGESLTTLLTAT